LLLRRFGFSTRRGRRDSTQLTTRPSAPWVGTSPTSSLRPWQIWTRRPRNYRGLVMLRVKEGVGNFPGPEPLIQFRQFTSRIPSAQAPCAPAMPPLALAQKSPARPGLRVRITITVPNPPRDGAKPTPDRANVAIATSAPLSDTRVLAGLALARPSDLPQPRGIMKRGVTR